MFTIRQRFEVTISVEVTAKDVAKLIQEYRKVRPETKNQTLARLAATIFDNDAFQHIVNRPGEFDVQAIQTLQSEQHTRELFQDAINENDEGLADALKEAGLL